MQAAAPLREIGTGTGENGVEATGSRSSSWCGGASSGDGVEAVTIHANYCCFPSSGSVASRRSATGTGIRSSSSDVSVNGTTGTGEQFSTTYASPVTDTGGSTGTGTSSSGQALRGGGGGGTASGSGGAGGGAPKGRRGGSAGCVVS